VLLTAKDSLSIFIIVLVENVVSDSVVSCAHKQILWRRFIVGNKERQVLAEALRSGIDSARVNFVLALLPPGPVLHLDVCVSAAVALVSPLGIVTREGGALIKDNVNEFLVAVHELVGARDGPLNVVILNAAAHAVLLVAINDNGVEEVVHELGQIENQVVVVQLLNVKHRLKVHLRLNVGQEFDLPVLHLIA
jgi:hypothetical protein